MATFDSTQQASAFEIKALSGVGDLVQEGQTFTLLGRALPYRGLSFEVTQRIQTTWYPGNPVALQQIMGATESNTTINGIWHDRYLADTSGQTASQLSAAQGIPAVDGMASLLVRNFDLLCRYGVPVEVRWGGGYVNGNLTGIVQVRRGLIKRFKHTWDRPQDVAWEIEFEWRGRDEDAAKAVSLHLTDARESLQVISSQFDDASDLITGVQEKQRMLLFKVTDAFSAAMEDVTDALGKANEAIADQVAGVVGGIHADGGLLDHGNASMAVALMANSVQTIQLGVEQIEALPLYALSVRDDALDLLSMVGDLLGLKQNLTATQQSAANTRDDLAGQITPEVLAEVQAPAGLDLRDLALKYYSDPDRWFAIAQYNGLTSSRVPDNPNGPSDILVQTIKIPAASLQTTVSQVC